MRNAVAPRRAEQELSREVRRTWPARRQFERQACAEAHAGQHGARLAASISEDSTRRANRSLLDDLRRT